MARRPSPTDRIEALLEKWPPEIRGAFLESIRDIVDRARLGAIVTALERGDIDGAIRAIGIDTAAFLPLDTTLRRAFIEAGTSAASTILTRQIVFRFDARNPAAEDWIATRSSEAIVEIVDDQRTAVRETVTEGMRQGANPRATALNIIGRVSAQTGRREGGIVGLTSQQAGYVANARRELASGDPEQMARYFTRLRRDRRFDPIVAKAIKAGKPLDQDTVARLTSRYADRLLAFRGEAIARTESLSALNAAAFEAYRQAVEKGTVSANAVRKTWKATKDKRTRDTHRELDGESVSLSETFRNGLMFPGDPSGPASEVINCRCRLIYRIDRLSNLE